MLWSTFLHTVHFRKVSSLQVRQEKTTKDLSETIESKHVCNMKMDNITIDLSLAKINTVPIQIKPINETIKK
jgi:hypothetical protein